VLWEWASAIHFSDHAGTSFDGNTLGAQFDGLGPSGAVTLDANKAVDLSTVEIIFVHDATTHTAHVESTGIIVDDDSSAEIGYMSAAGNWKLETPIDCTTNVVIQFQPIEIQEETINSLTVDDDGFVSAQLSAMPDPGSLVVRWAVYQETYSAAYRKYEVVETMEVCS
jgi:hypothetical protein